MESRHQQSTTEGDATTEKIHHHPCPRVIKEAEALYINIRRAVAVIEEAIGVPVWIQHLLLHCALLLNPSIIESHNINLHHTVDQLIRV